MTGWEKYSPKTRRNFVLGVGIALIILLATILSGLLIMRRLVREQIVQRDGDALYATTLMEQLDFSEMDEDPRPAEQMSFDAAVRSSRLRGVMGIRFFNPEGGFSDTFPATVMPHPLGADALSAIRQLEPHSRFVASMSMDDIFIYLPQFSKGRISRIPVVLVTVPLHARETRELNGAAQFIIEGHSMADEFMRLDRRLCQIGLITFAISGSLLVAMLWPAFSRSQKLTRELAQRSERLQRANDELALAARVSAVGAISSHLMHGLRNPLASLSEFIAGQHADDHDIDRDDLEDALSASRRMQTLVEHTVQVLSDAKGDPAYELTVPELGEDVLSRVKGAAEKRDVELVFSADGRCALSGRVANLLGLILVNLLENSIEASGRNGTVALKVSRLDDWLRFRVEDTGSGIPGVVQERLFLPGKSSREGGSGIGLAISKQIADYLDARLVLEDSTEAGSVFLLELPMTVCMETDL
ncbi:sensor histidine kinase [Pontiella agarivorans]|uniref:histidine kinase n=1 Tax=Pontiella agarivorans TaxID=3038953 RepID=A0ABU5MVB0_9BACT|nr:HAMP domain-containing sensor histidine kinase [Pontiella agarivorans]MDZ8118137.1 HAMP domain-containing sensor histidine kinase [Pontiella agarivorans]